VLEKQHTTLSRRERQILDILYRGDRLTAAEIREAMADAPSYSAVRALLRTLEEKGHVRHQEKNLRYVYFPAVSRARASRSAVSHLVRTFFQGSVTQAVAALIESADGKLTQEELVRLEEMIAVARKEGR
jgi:predicted transcriptional regulator